jgi:hypothetical protein
MAGQRWIFYLLVLPERKEKKQATAAAAKSAAPSVTNTPRLGRLISVALESPCDFVCDKSFPLRVSLENAELGEHLLDRLVTFISVFAQGFLQN